MKTLLVLVTLLGVIGVSVQAQTSPFKASQGAASALASAKSSGLPKAALTSIATLGDTTFFGAYLPATVKSLLQFKFDASAGTSSFWGYRFHDVVNSKDTNVAAVVLKILVSYQAIQTPLPDIPNLPIRLDSALPATYMDSDVMAAKISANLLYKSYMTQHTAAKFQAISLGMSRGGMFPDGPMWIVFVGEKISEPSLECYVPAENNNGAAVCMELPGTAVEESSLPTDRMRIQPNPSVNSLVQLHIPLASYEPRLDIEILNVLGDEQYRTSIERIGGGVDVQLDLHTLPAGMYYARVHNGSRQQVLSFILDK